MIRYMYTGGEVIHCYASCNIFVRTGEADNSVLYAGYQYDEETELYYLNARMCDPVTARFLQADTYLGNQADPLSLNLYTYCLNNPERYIDPSGHFALELAAILVTAVVLGMTIDIAIQKFVEQKVCIDLDRTITEGVFSGLIALYTFGASLAVNTVGRTAASGVKAAGTVRTIANALIRSAVFGATAEAAQDMAHQYFIEGRSFAQIDYRRVGISAALGTVISAGSTMVGAGINQLRAVRTGAHTTQLVGDVMQGGMPMGHNILQSPRMLKLNLQFFASKADDGVGRTVGDVVDGETVSMQKYYQVTSRENAKALLESDSPALKGTEFREVYAWTVQPTLKQAQNSGARSLDTVIQFETSATFSKDTSMDDMSLWDIARVSDRPGPISISNVVEVGFKNEKRWWQFWKK